MGLPAKSSISGIVQLVVPNVCGICIWSPPLAQTGSSHKGIKVDFLFSLSVSLPFTKISSSAK